MKLFVSTVISSFEVFFIRTLKFPRSISEDALVSLFILVLMSLEYVAMNIIARKKTDSVR